MSNEISNLGSDVILHALMAVRSVVTFLVNQCFILRKSKVPKSYWYTNAFPIFFFMKNPRSSQALEQESYHTTEMKFPLLYCNYPDVKVYRVYSPCRNS